MMASLAILSNKASEKFTADVCNHGIVPTRARVGRFRDGEVDVQILENVRGKDTFIIGSTHMPLENAWELYLLAAAARDSSAQRITLVIPYLAHNRADRKDRSRIAIAGMEFIRWLKNARANRVLLVDIHSGATAGHFLPQMCVDHLHASHVLIPHLREMLTTPCVIASPDAGGVSRARMFARHLGLKFVVFDKERPKPGEIGEVTLVGDVSGHTVVFVDDIIDSGNTVKAGAEKAKREGATRVIVVATHGVLSLGFEVFKGSGVDEVIITDSIPRTDIPVSVGDTKITLVSIAPMIAGALQRIHHNESLSGMFLDH